MYGRYGKWVLGVLLALGSGGARADAVAEVLGALRQPQHPPVALEGLDPFRRAPTPVAGLPSGPSQAISTWLQAGGPPAPTATAQALAAEIRAQSQASLAASAGFPAAGDRATNPLRGKTLVFISLGMPDAALKALLEQARGRDDVVFYLRGWQPPKLQAVFAHLHRLIDLEKNPVIVLIDPHPFKDYQIQQVPVFLAEDPRGGPLRRLDGEIALEGALARLRADEPLPEHPIGQLHPIAEPDIIDYAREKAARLDWPTLLAEARTRAKQHIQGVALPAAKQDQTYYVDLSVRVKQDIHGPNGLLARAGTVINPLTQVLVRSHYVFFDPASPAQLAIVKDWLREHRNVVLIATELAPLSAARVALSAELGQPVYHLNPTLASRFQLREVPALAMAEGPYLKVITRSPLLTHEH
ncbi:MAG: hypothetical protein EOM92_12175 [Gammaproteobacteria bacterium]|nr:hypothetical protein [Gammaproteobacteria bacterium]